MKILLPKGSGSFRRFFLEESLEEEEEEEEEEESGEVKVRVKSEENRLPFFIAACAGEASCWRRLQVLLLCPSFPQKLQAYPMLV